MNCCIIRKYAIFVSERSYGSRFSFVLLSTNLVVDRVLFKPKKQIPFFKEHFLALMFFIFENNATLLILENIHDLSI